MCFEGVRSAWCLDFRGFVATKTSYPKKYMPASATLDKSAIPLSDINPVDYLGDEDTVKGHGGNTVFPLWLIFNKSEI